MDVHGATVWIEGHPVEAAVIGGAGVLGLLWLFGFFSSSSSASSGQTNLAAAYYAAEAQSAVVGGQIQVASIAATRDTAIAGLQANAATAIAGLQTSAATTINQQNTDTALATVTSNNATALGIDASNNNAGLMQTVYGKLLPYELKLTKGKKAAVTGPDGQVISISHMVPVTGAGGSSPITATQAKAAGYTAKMWAALTGLPGWTKKTSKNWNAT